MRAVACLALLAVASPALASVNLLVPEFAEPPGGAGEATRARLAVVRALGAYPDISIAPLSRYKRLAARHRLNPRQLGTGHAASVLGRYEALDGVLMGIVVNGEAGPSLRLVLFDPTGTAVFRTELPLEGGGVLPAKAAESAAASVAGSLGVRTPPRPALPPAPTLPVQPPPQPAAASATLADEAPPEEPAPPPKAGDPLFTFSLYLPLAARSYSLTTPSVSPGPFLTFDTSSPYAGVAGEAALFPLVHESYWLQGIGVIASGSAGFISSSFEGQSFGSQDLRAGGDLTYRLLIHAFSTPEVDPAVGLRLGLAWFHVGVDSSNPVGLENIDRVAPKIGLEYLQGVASWLRLGLNGAVFPGASPGSAEAAVYGAASGFGWQLQLTASGLFGLGGLGYAVKLDYLAFSDHFAGNPTTGQAATDASESYIDIWLGLSYAFF